MAPDAVPNCLKYFLQSLGEKCYANSAYIDDCLLLLEDYEQNIDDTVYMSEGTFTFHPLWKSVIIPTQRIVYLGFGPKLGKMTVKLTEDKTSKIFLQPAWC